MLQDFSLSIYSIFWVINYLTVITIVILLLFEDSRSSPALLGWTLVLFFIPILGIIIFIYSGINLRKYKIFKNRGENHLKRNYSKLLKEQASSFESFDGEEFSDVIKSIKLNFNTTGSPVSFFNKVKIFNCGEDKFNSLLTDLENAKSSIYMEYYIWRSDSLGNKIKEILVKKAKEGLDIRLIFDGFGCLGYIKKKYRDDLKKAGVKFKYFLDPLILRFNPLINFRNHRKIVVIDSFIGYTGGMNIGQEYIDGGKKFDSWRDTHVRIEGEACEQLFQVFYSDWINSDGEPFKNKKIKYQLGEESISTQIVCTGPDSDYYSMEMLYLNLISNANKSVYIQSPYFIPSDELIHALQCAALSGLDIKIIITGVQDQLLSYNVAETFFDRLTKIGIKIYRYKKGYYHPKVFIIDDYISSIGTCNFDIRSLRLDYEINAIFYDKKISKNLKKEFEKDLKYSIIVKENYFKKLKFYKKIGKVLCKFSTPLL